MTIGGFVRPHLGLGRRAPGHPRWTTAIAALTALGLIARFLLMARIDDLSMSGPDGPSYHVAAVALIDGSDPWAVWELRVFPVGYAQMLAGAYRLFGAGSIWALLILQVCALLLSCLALAKVARRALSPAVSVLLFAGLWLAPASVEASTSLMYEGVLIPASTVILASILAFAGLSLDRRWPPIVGASAGALIGVAVHPRYGVLVLGVAIAVLAWGRKGRAMALSLVGCTLGGLLLVASWNAANLGVWTVSSNQGSNLVLGLPMDGARQCAIEVYEPTDWPSTTPTGDRMLTDCAIGWVKDHPSDWLAGVPGKVAGHFEPASIRAAQSLFPVGGDGPTRLARVVGWGIALVTGAAAVVGISILWRNERWRPLVYVCGAAIAGPLAVSILFFGLGRFSYGSLPFILLLAAIGFVRVVSRYAPIKSDDAGERCRDTHRN